MNRSEFEETMRMFHAGDFIRLICRGNYGSYEHKGRLVKVERGRVYLHDGFSHSYRRITRIHFS